MRVGFDLHTIDGKFQGSRTHVIELFSRVAGRCPDIEFYALLDGVDRLLVDYPAFDLPNVRRVRLAQTGAIRRLVWELPRLQRRLRLNLLHAQYIIPMPSPSRTMVTIHDVLFESHPQYFTWPFRLRSRLLMRWAAYRSEHVFTVSEFSRHEICRRYGLTQDRISVIPNGVDMRRFAPGAAGAELLARRGLASGGYFLTVGRLEPRKNHLTLLRAHARLGSGAPPLVIVGQRDFGYRDLIEELSRPEVRGRVKVFEDVTDDELPALYRHCLGFVYPSFAEGFGMPPLEAMASGVPVIVADNTALTEVVGDAGLRVGSTDVPALEQALRRLWHDGALRQRLAQAGLRHAQGYSWDIAAECVARAYRRLDTARS